LLTLAILESTVFFVLSLVHFNWVVGGKFGFAKALPTNVNGERVLNPQKKDSLIVALGLLLFALYYLQVGVVGLHLIAGPQWLLTFLGWGIPLVFFLRIIGDFKYIGIFKKIKDTGFAVLDNKFYIPLCFFLFINGVIIKVV